MYGKVMKFLGEQIGAARPSILRNRVLDILGGPRVEVVFKYQTGQVVQDKGSADASDSARTYRITGRRLISGNPYYRLTEAATDVELGLFHEESIEPYGLRPENQAEGAY